MPLQINRVHRTNSPVLQLSSLLLLLLILAPDANASRPGHNSSQEVMTKVVLNPGIPVLPLNHPQGLTSRTGIIRADTAGTGLLLESPDGVLHTLPPQAIREQIRLADSFRYPEAGELAAELQKRLPDAGIRFTEHYVLAGKCEPLFLQFAGDLLERVYQQYDGFFKSYDFVSKPRHPLPVVILPDEEAFSSITAELHPELNLGSTPGYYSIRHNIILMLDLTAGADASGRSGFRRVMQSHEWQVATIVHEAVHQLAFNTGLQVRMADNPLWITEGLAMYFEPPSPNSQLFWTRPGRPNPVHLPLAKQAAAGGTLQLPLESLVADDSAFATPATNTAAYCESWALFYWLQRYHPDALRDYLRVLSTRPQLQNIDAETRLREFRELFGPAADAEAAVVRDIQRLRIR